jgi:hypothetical protein
MTWMQHGAAFKAMKSILQETPYRSQRHRGCRSENERRWFQRSDDILKGISNHSKEVEDETSITIIHFNRPACGQLRSHE